MKIFKKIANVRTVASAKDTVSKCADQFAPKPFVLEFKGIATGAKIASFALSVASIAISCSYLLNTIEKDVPFIVAALLTAFTLLLVEYVKHVSIKKGFECAVKQYNALSFGMIVLAVLSVAASIFFAYKGSSYLGAKLSDTTELQAAFVAKNSALKADFSKEIEQVKKEKQAYEKSITWNGRINAHNEANKAALLAFSADIERITAQFEQDKTALDADHQQAVSRVVAVGQSDTNTLLYISIAVEFLLVLCALWGVYYTYKVAKEAIDEGVTDTTVYTSNEVNNLLFKALLGANSAPFPLAIGSVAEGAVVANAAEKPTQKSQIGFSFKTGGVNTAAVKTGAVNTGGVNTGGVKTSGNRECTHCGSLYTYKVHNQKFCSDACRIAAWEQKTNRKFSVKRKP